MGIHERLRQRAFRSVEGEAWVSVVVAGEHLSREAEAVFRKHDVTGDQYNVLRILRGAGTGGLARGEITERLMRRAPDTTRMLDRLERAGLVERQRDAEDARRSVARVTKEGLALLEKVDPELERAMREATAPLSRRELRELARLCGALVG